MNELAETHVVKVNADHPEPVVIEMAARYLRSGGLVAFPTETVYGLGANALDTQAVSRIFLAKGRPTSNPLIVHIAAHEQIDQVAIDIPQSAHELAERFWPGALTLILKRHPAVAANVSAGRDTVAVRIPDHAVALALIQAAGVPVAAPSANRFTRPSATSAQHVLQDLGGQVDLILDGGSTPIGLESTVLDLTSSIPTVLRPGGVTVETLRAHLPLVELRAALIGMDDADAVPLAPGMLSKHYSPNAELLLFEGPFDAVTARMQAEIHRLTGQDRRVGVLALDEEQALFEYPGVQVLPLGPRDDPGQVGHNLFAALRALDEQGVDAVLVRAFAPVGLGTTINDRLLRAAEGRMIRVQEGHDG